MKKSIMALGALVTLVLGTETTLASASTPSSRVYTVHYFSNNHDDLTFEAGNKFLGSNTGTLTVHVGDKIKVIADDSPKLGQTKVDVVRLNIVDQNIKASGHSGLELVTKLTQNEVDFTAKQAGSLIVTFKRGHSKLDGRFTVHIVK